MSSLYNRFAEKLKKYRNNDNIMKNMGFLIMKQPNNAFIEGKEFGTI